MKDDKDISFVFHHSLRVTLKLRDSESEIDNLQNVERVGKGYTVSPSLSSSMLMTPSFQISDGLRVEAIVAL